MNCWYEDVCAIKQDSCENSCVRYISMCYLVEQSNIPENRQIPTLLYPPKEDKQAFIRLNEIKTNIVDFVESGKNLYIYSNNTGNGKTSWSIKLMMKYFNDIWPGNGDKCRGIFIHAPMFLTQLKNFGTKDDAFTKLKYNLSTVDLVIWDDIASTGMSAYDLSQLTSYIDVRIFNRVSNIYTGNLGEKELEKQLGQRLKSRVWNASEVIEFKGGDNR